MGGFVYGAFNLSRFVSRCSGECGWFMRDFCFVGEVGVGVNASFEVIGLVF